MRRYSLRELWKWRRCLAAVSLRFERVKTPRVKPIQTQSESLSATAEIPSSATRLHSPPIDPATHTSRVAIQKDSVLERKFCNEHVIF